MNKSNKDIYKYIESHSKDKSFPIYIDGELYICKEGRCAACHFFKIIHNNKGGYVQCLLPLDQDTSYKLCNPSWGYRCIIKISGGI